VTCTRAYEMSEAVERIETFRRVELFRKSREPRMSQMIAFEGRMIVARAAKARASGNEPRLSLYIRFKLVRKMNRAMKVESDSPCLVHVLLVLVICGSLYNIPPSVGFPWPMPKSPGRQSGLCRIRKCSCRGEEVEERGQRNDELYRGMVVSVSSTPHSSSQCSKSTV